MSVPIPPPDPYNVWRRLVAVLLLAIWPVGGFILLLGSAAGEESAIGRGFAALVEAPWWAVTSACRGRYTATLFAVPANLRVAGDFVIGASALALMTAWAADPATAQVADTPLWGCLLFSVGVSLIDAGITLQERRARPPRSENGA
jgi:hypothetical protein